LLGQESIGRTFEALDAFRSTAGYEELCALHESEQCTIKSVTQFWNNSYDIFTAQISSDEEAILAMSASTFPDGTPVDHKAIIGKPEFDADGVLTSGELLSTTIDLPSAEDGDPAESFEDKALDVVLGLQSQWDNEEGNIFSLEVTVERSFADEFTRAITNDLPLVPAVFVTMAIFTCIVFFKRDWVKSRSLLGFGAVVGVLLSLLSGFGLMFLIGVPFTSMTQILPFVLFGIGLDDAFIISGEYARTDTKKSAVERVHDTIDEVGVSIFVTTLTSVTAFALGTTSTIPAVYWLCQYGKSGRFKVPYAFFVGTRSVTMAFVSSLQRFRRLSLTSFSRLPFLSR
jgi:Niemann-Pick C1 protein